VFGGILLHRTDLRKAEEARPNRISRGKALDFFKPMFFDKPNLKRDWPDYVHITFQDIQNEMKLC
jgi:hypothetical protein